ncbi:MAG: phosphatidylglycerophosphatase A, partial [Halobacteriovoraceae bacterium]|nr:phosphatidylglycerophosphatase A [Halobacteriovoraceae bacterium]
MKEKNAPSLSHPEIMFLSFFGVGFLPKAPGTWGTLAILPILVLLSWFKAPFFLFIPFLIMMTVVSCFIADRVQKKFELHDPSWIVIDEVVGMWTAWLFTQDGTLSVVNIVLIFGLFRFFDIFKIWPASYFDKEVTHGAGTILDDIISG